MNLSKTALFAAAVAVAAVSVRAADKPKGAAMTDDQKVSYVIAQQVGQNFKTQGIAIDVPTFAASLQDALDGKPGKFTPEETQEIFQGLQKKAMERMKAMADKNKADGAAFLKANKKKKGVVATKSGLQYLIEKPGQGAHPKAEDRVKVHYKGTLLDGSEFDSSYKRGQPAEFPLNGVIKGWTEGLQYLSPGAKATLFIPADLAYGEQGRPGIPPNSTLVFEVELLEILKSDAAAK
jgi:FKBP-type peptidyl-prolyl cis-trans isomerase FkpA/FKBP-type peptidyl-prolyl cis-trans isomerase FklB